MTVCGRCGSIQIVRPQPTAADTLVALLTGRRPFQCRRCGWRGRRDWTDDDVENSRHQGAGGAEPDPALAVLDFDQPTRSRNRFAPGTTSEDEHALEGLVLDPVTVASVEPSGLSVVPNDEQHGKPASRRRKNRNRRKRAGRRGMLAAMAGTALLMFLAVILTLTDGCRSRSDELGRQLNRTVSPDKDSVES